MPVYGPSRQQYLAHDSLRKVRVRQMPLEPSVRMKESLIDAVRIIDRRAARCVVLEHDVVVAERRALDIQRILTHKKTETEAVSCPSMIRPLPQELEQADREKTSLPYLILPRDDDKINVARFLHVAHREGAHDPDHPHRRKEPEELHHADRLFHLMIDPVVAALPLRHRSLPAAQTIES